LDPPYVHEVVGVLKTYYRMASDGGVAEKQCIIKNETLRKAIQDFSVSPAPKISLYICKIFIVLSDHPSNAYLMSSLGYSDLLAILCDQPLPPKLLTKLMQVQTRLMNAQRNGPGEAEKKAVGERKQRRNKELTFLLPFLTAHQQNAVSQCVLRVSGCISTSFKSDFEKQTSRCCVTCKANVEARKIANELTKIGFEDVDYLYKNDNGQEEMFTFYRDENFTPPPEDLPQYLDDNIAVFDPATALVNNNATKQGGWFTSVLSSIW